MKKYITSFLLIGTFSAYAAYMRFGGLIVWPGIARPAAVTAPTDSQKAEPKGGTAGVPAPVSNATPPPTSGQTSVPPPAPAAVPPAAGQYKDGTYTGKVADAFYGNIQVKAVIQNGRIADVIFLQYPNDRGTSIEINTQAMPYLKQEAIAAQNANVDIVSGATDSSDAFRVSLASALAQAQ